MGLPEKAKLGRIQAKHRAFPCTGVLLPSLVRTAVTFLFFFPHLNSSLLSSQQKKDLL